MYQRVILTSASIIVLSVSAFAGDMGRSAPTDYKDGPYMPAHTWSGFYLGAGGGGGAVNHDLKASFSGTGSADLNGVGGAGGFGTVQVGYDHQLGQRVVVGVFFDYDFDSIDSSLTLSGTPSRTIKGTLTDMLTAGGRSGYLVNPNTLVYGLAGYSEAHFDLPFNLNGDFGGWTAGAGIETNLGGPLFLKGEYRFTQLDEKTLYSRGSFKFTDQPDIQTGRLVLTYKQNNGGYDSLK